MEMKRYLLLCLGGLLITAAGLHGECADTCELTDFCSGTGTWSGGTWQGTGSTDCICRPGSLWTTCERMSFEKCRRHFDKSGKFLFASDANTCIIGDWCQGN
jgi:hypothetical protein